MSAWQVEFKPSADREFRKLPREAQAKIRTAIRRLAETGLGDVTAMKGNQAGKSRLRVGDFRVVFERQNDRLVILVLHVGNRRDIYQT